jgi:DNA-binding CsgD family transcriptional regulator
VIDGRGPFVGRPAELRRALAACSASRGTGALVIGGTGVGKTRFAREIAAAWSESGAEVIWVGATESGRRFPFGAFVGVVDDLDPKDFGGSARRVLDSLSRDGTPLLVVDDAHLLDDASATLVHHLALSAGRFVLLVTMALDHSCPDAVAALRKDGPFDIIELGPLRIDAVAAALEIMLGGDVERATSARLFELSEGNPFVLRELVEATTTAGVLAVRRGVWSWHGDLPFSPALNELVARRLERVDPRVRHVLELLALAEPLGLPELNAASSPSAVAAAEAAGLVVVERQQRRAEVRIAQVLYARLVRAALGHVRTVELLGDLDAVLERVPGRRPSDRLKRAVIRLDVSERRPGDAETFTEASRLARPDYEMAERLARAALEAGAGFTAIDYLVDALLWQGRIEEAREVADTVGEDLSPEEREYFSLRLTRMLWWMGGERPADPATFTTEGSDEPTSTWLATTARQVGMAAAAGQGPEVIAPALGVLDDPEAGEEARCWAAGAAMIGLGGQGRVSAALALVDNAYECARRLTDFNYRLLLSVIDVWIRRLAGDLSGARAAIEELKRALATSINPNAGLVTLFEARLTLSAGRAREAIPLLRDAAARLDEADFGGLSASAHYWLAEALALTGDGPSAAAQLALGAEAEEKTLDMFRPEQLLAKAWACVGIGDRKLAVVILTEAARMAASQGEQLVEVHVHHAGVRLGDRSASRRLVKLAPGVEGSFAASAGRHAQALLTGEPGELAEVGESFEAQGGLAEAVDALAQAAAAARRRGDGADSRRMASRAAALAQEVGGLDTPALRAAVLDPPLTRRQRDVARLAASGRSNREIAQQLGVGIRTVESHLDAAYRRVGVSSRTELLDLFPEERRPT